MLSSRCIVSIKNMPLWYDDYTAYHHLACIIITIQLLMIPYDSIFFRKIKFTYEPRQQTGILDIHISYLCKHLHILCHKLISFIFWAGITNTADFDLTWLWLWWWHFIVLIWIYCMQWSGYWYCHGSTTRENNWLIIFSDWDLLFSFSKL